MAAKTVASIRQAVAAAVAGVSGWRESTLPYDVFGTGEAESLYHQGFAVGVPDTTPMGDRQRLAEGTNVTTTVGVRWSYALGAQRMVEDQDAALAAEQSIIQAVMAIGQSRDLHLILTGASRQIIDPEWIRGEITFRGIHLLALQ